MLTLPFPLFYCMLSSINRCVEVQTYVNVFWLICAFSCWKGTSKITIICPNSRIDVEWDGEAFKKMENLRTLIIMDGEFTESPKHLPNSLRILIHCLDPSWGLPSQFYPRKLAICEIRSYTLFEWGDFFKKASVMYLFSHCILVNSLSFISYLFVGSYLFYFCRSSKIWGF